mgnify:CR=1 FL=1
MNPSPVRFALVGCGENAKKSIVPAILQSPVADVVATMDVRLDLAQDLAGETGADLVEKAGRVGDRKRHGSGFHLSDEAVCAAREQAHGAAATDKLPVDRVTPLHLVLLTVPPSDLT